MRTRLQKIKSDLEGVRRRRNLHMDRRKKSSIPMATLVGYTNAGKSTLFNALSNAKVTAADQLFSTLDPVTRRIRLPSGAPLLLSDTVGFIQKLSPSVVAAFRATLEELATVASARELFGGQADDLRFDCTNATAEDVESVHMRKSAALIAASITGGAHSYYSPLSEWSVTYSWPYHLFSPFSWA